MTDWKYALMQVYWDARLIPPAWNVQRTMCDLNDLLTLACDGDPGCPPFSLARRNQTTRLQKAVVAFRKKYGDYVVCYLRRDPFDGRYLIAPDEYLHYETVVGLDEASAVDEDDRMMQAVRAVSGGSGE